MKLKITSVLFFLLTVVFATAQNGNLTGQISDEDGLPLPGATVILDNLAYSTTTDFDGNFTFLDVDPHAYQVNVSYVGFAAFNATVDVKSGETTNFNIVLSPMTTALGEVQISATVSGQSRAIAQQKKNLNITNIVSADQMGKFPDSNIGESMRRIPGITIQNDQGEARNIIIRGMAPQLNSVTLNGERIPSAEAETRSIQMDLIPADMIQTVQVNKAVTPDMDGDAIGGSVNLVTRTAPAKERFSASAGTGMATFNNKALYNASLIYGNRVANDKFGFVVSASYNNVDYGSDNVEFERVEGDRENADKNDDTVLADYQIRQYYVQRIRKSISTNLDYKFNNNHAIVFRGIYNNRNDFENRYRLRYKDLNEDEYSIERQTKGGSADNKYRRLEDQKMWNVQLAGEHLFGKLKVNWSVANSKASEDRPNERYAVYRNKDLDIATADFSNYTNNTRKGYITTTGGEHQDYANHKLKEFTEEHQYTEEEDLNARIDFTLPVAKRQELKFGARYRSKDKLRNNNFFEYEDINDKYEFMTSHTVQTRDYTNPDFLAGSQYQSGKFATEQFLAALNFQGADFEKTDLKEEYLTGNYDAKEDITAGFAMYTADFSKVNLLVGARVERTDVVYNGNSFDEETGATGKTSGTKNYTNVLPNFQLKYAFTNNTFIRAAYTATIARPNYYDLVPYQNINSDELEVSLGNTNLKATTANNFDLMFDTYFGKTGMFSFGAFAKQLDNFIYKKSSILDDPNSEFDGYDITQRVNGKNAQVFGFEAAVQSDLSFVSSAKFFENMHVYANYTFTETKTNGVEGREDGLALPGTAGDMYNLSLAYDNSKFLFKVSSNFTSGYIDEYGDFDLLDRYYDKQFFLDVNTSYSFSKKATVFASATNLTNQELRYYQGTEDVTMQMEYYGLRLNLGVKVNL